MNPYIISIRYDHDDERVIHMAPADTVTPEALGIVVDYRVVLFNSEGEAKAALECIGWAAKARVVWGQA
jgi:hypothetical protein